MFDREAPGNLRLISRVNHIKENINQVKIKQAKFATELIPSDL